MGSMQYQALLMNADVMTCYPAHQIVLVDDASNHTDITTTLPLYIKSRLPSKVANQHHNHMYLHIFTNMQCITTRLG